MGDTSWPQEARARKKRYFQFMSELLRNIYWIMQHKHDILICIIGVKVLKIIVKKL